jgi:histidine triad (HIT) family protein
MNAESGSNVAGAEDRRKHLDFIQAVITRMSAASATTKGWLLPVVTVTYGYPVTKRADSVALLGIGAVILFALIDANYLNQERSFRRLYDAVAAGRNVPPFSMDPSLAAPAAPAVSGAVPGRLRRAFDSVREWFPDGRVWSSWAIAPLYGPMLLAGVLILLRAM